jgi:hypothetical protein
MFGTSSVSRSGSGSYRLQKIDTLVTFSVQTSTDKCCEYIEILYSMLTFHGPLLRKDYSVKKKLVQIYIGMDPDDSKSRIVIRIKIARIRNKDIN